MCVCVWLIHEGKNGFKQPTLPESLCQVAKDCPSCHIALPGFWWQGNTLESHRIGPAVGGSQRSSIIFCFPNSMSPISCTCQLGPKAWHRSLAPNNHLPGAAVLATCRNDPAQAWTIACVLASLYDRPLRFQLYPTCGMSCVSDRQPGPFWHKQTFQYILLIFVKFPVYQLQPIPPANPALNLHKADLGRDSPHCHQWVSA